MINLGMIDILLLLLLLTTLAFAIKRHRFESLYVVFVLVALIEIERLAPGTFAKMGDMIRGIDAINAQMPHLEIQPIIRVAP